MSSVPIESRLMRFFNFVATGPCEGYGGRSTFYSWAAIGDGSRASTVDYAPDDPRGLSLPVEGERHRTM